MPSPEADYLIRRIAPERTLAELADFPCYFEIETVNACQARCPMCTIGDWQRHSPSMKDDLFEKVAAEICANAEKVKRVALYRDGEPLLDKKLAKRVKRLKDGGIGNVGISTNVELLDEKRGTSLLEAGIDEVVLSIDSLDKQVFEAIRVGLDFDTVLTNALRFIELRDRIRPQTSIWVRMIRQETNKDEWSAFEKFWKPLLEPNDRCYFLNIHNWGNQLAGYKPVAPNDPHKPCVVFWSLMVIFANGGVPMCNVDYNNKFPLGNVREQSIAELWRSSLQASRRGMHLSGQRQSMPMCSKCTVWDEAA